MFNPFAFTGCIGRRVWLAHTVAMALWVRGLGWALPELFAHTAVRLGWEPQGQDDLVWIAKGLGWAATLPFLWAFCALAVRRLRDIGAARPAMLVAGWMALALVDMNTLTHVLPGPRAGGMSLVGSLLHLLCAAGLLFWPGRCPAGDAKAPPIEPRPGNLVGRRAVSGLRS